ncbi:hypothetical protein DFH28DRAFT_892890 [Melampsora americana]|nr:hypothetical protein DFH28DRAFT_1083173 [Melampsora americana]KAH9815449.1 hypothetical protein DFH28DRAFT_892890 [Melampsora americana]
MSDHLTKTSHPAWSQFQSVPKDYDFFFESDFNPRDTTCDKLRFIMKHFGLKAKLRGSGVRKPELVQNFKETLFPIIQPFIRKSPAVDEIAIDKPHDATKLNLEDAATTKQVLYDELKRLVPSLLGTSLMDRSELVRLYRASVLLEKNQSLGQALESRFITKPDLWSHEELLRKRRDDIRSALQFHAPYIFIPTKCLTLEICTRIYEKFLLGMDVEADVIVEGAHFYIRS